MATYDSLTQDQKYDILVRHEISLYDIATEEGKESLKSMAREYILRELRLLEGNIASGMTVNTKYLADLKSRFDTKTPSQQEDYIEAEIGIR